MCPLVAVPELLATSIERVLIDDIHPAPRNANEGDVGAITASVEALGEATGHEGGAFYQVIFVQTSTGDIIAGEHRWETLKAKGSPIAPVVWLDVDDATAERIRVGDNEIPRRTSRTDDALLAEILTDLLQDTPEGLAGTGFDDEDLNRLLADLSTDFSRPDAGQTAQDRHRNSFAVSEVRQVVLTMGVEAFERLVGIMKRMRDAEGALESNTDCVLAWAERWDAANPPAG